MTSSVGPFLPSGYDLRIQPAVNFGFALLAVISIEFSYALTKSRTGGGPQWRILLQALERIEVAVSRGIHYLSQLAHDFRFFFPEGLVDYHGKPGCGGFQHGIQTPGCVMQIANTSWLRYSSGNLLCSTRVIIQSGC